MQARRLESITVRSTTRIPAVGQTFPDRLEDLGVTWKVYQNELSAVPSGLHGEADGLAGQLRR